MAIISETSLVHRITAEVIGLILTTCVLTTIGCGSGSIVPTGPAPKAKFVYTANSKSGDLSGYAVDPTSGVLTPLNGFPIASGGNPDSVIHDPLNQFVIVADDALNVLRVYGINASTGMLAEIQPSPYFVGHEPRSLAIDPTGRFVYVANQALDSVTAFSMNASGVLTLVPGSPFATGGNTESIGTCSIIVNPSGKFLYVVDLNYVYSFGIDNSTGALTLITTVPGPVQGDGLALDPAGTFLYAVGPGSNWIESFSINSTTGSITRSQSSPLALQNGAYTISIVPSGQFAYTVESGQTLVGYRLQNGILTSLSASYSGALGSLQLAIDPTGSFIYAPQTGTANNVSGFRISTSGMLSQLAGSPTPSDQWPLSITITSQ